MNKIILGTSSYKSVDKGNTVSISGDGGERVGYSGQTYKKLAPRLSTYIEYSNNLDELYKLKEDITLYAEFRRKIEDKYIENYYETRLKDLNVEELLEKLKSKFGEEIILLCYEELHMFCHRRILADWIELKSGVVISEISVKDGNVKILKAIDYKDRLKKYL